MSQLYWHRGSALGPGNGLWSSARGGHARKSTAYGQRRDDDAIFAPASAHRGGSVAQNNRRAALHGDLFQFQVRKESDPLAVGRKERVARIFSAAQQCWRGLVQALIASCRLPPGPRARNTSWVPSGEIPAVMLTPAIASGPRSTLSRISGRSAGRVRATSPRPKLPRQPAPPPTGVRCRNRFRRATHRLTCARWSRRRTAVGRCISHSTTP